MKKTMTLSVFAVSLLSSTAWAQVVVRIGPPPRVVVERPVPPPGKGYLWQPGYYRWAGGRYVWVGGRYALPPRPGVVWVAPHWTERSGSWVFVEGVWR